MAQITIVIPYILEYPSILFTIRNIYEELKDFDTEICVGDNWCGEIEEQGQKPDRAHRHLQNGEMVSSCLETMTQQNSWLKYFKYDVCLSHWQVKNHIIHNTTSPYIMFMDAHCMASRGSLSAAFEHYLLNEQYLDGTLSCPLTYDILGNKKLVYKLVYDKMLGKCDYTFMPMPDTKEVTLQVPTMSSCGLIVSRKIFNLLIDFPQQYMYSGGEHYLFQSLAVLGKKMWIFNGNPLHHHGEKRGYTTNFIKWHINRAISCYCMGEDWFKNYIDNIGCIVPLCHKSLIADMATEQAQYHAKHINKHKIMSIEEAMLPWITNNTY